MPAISLLSNHMSSSCFITNLLSPYLATRFTNLLLISFSMLCRLINLPCQLSNPRKYSFVVRSVENWNRLPGKRESSHKWRVLQGKAQRTQWVTQCTWWNKRELCIEKNTKNSAIKERNNIYHGTRKISVKGLYGKPARTSRTGRLITTVHHTDVTATCLHGGPSFNCLIHFYKRWWRPCSTLCFRSRVWQKWKAAPTIAGAENIWRNGGQPS